MMSTLFETFIQIFTCNGFCVGVEQGELNKTTMKTQIYKTYSDFLNRENKLENGNRYVTFNAALLHATWQQRTIALAQTLGVEIE